MKGGGKIKLSQDYDNWWSIAGDVYGGVAGQRAYAVLKEANPGIDRFYRGMTINVPRIDIRRVKLTDEQVAKERGQWDYQADRPSDAYFGARAQTEQGQPQAVQTTQAGFPAPLYEGQQYPQALSPSVIQLETGARVYAPYPWQNATPAGDVGSMGGIRPSMAPLQEFFYGVQQPRQSTAQPQPEQPVTPRQRAQARRFGGRNVVQAAQPPQALDLGTGQRRFDQGQYGARFAGQPRYETDTGIPVRPEPQYQPPYPTQQGTRRFQEGQYGEQFEFQNQLAAEIAQDERWAFRDHTWLEPWMRRNMPSGVMGGTPTPEDIERLPRDVQEMLFVLGIIEPTFSAGQATANMEFSRGVGRTPTYSRGGRGGGGGRTPRQYGSRPSYPARGYGGRGASSYENLIKWNI